MQDHFSAKAAAYAAHRPTLPPQTAAWLAEVAPGRALAWDAGCGSGQFSRLLAEHFATVHASDAFAGQIAAAPPHPRIAYRVEPAEACSLPDGSADLAAAAQAAHWFDMARFAGEARRVLRPGGVVALLTYGRFRMEGAAGAALAWLHDEVLGPWWPEERRHVLEEYRGLAFPFDRIAAPAFEIERAWGWDAVAGYVETWSAVKRAEEGGAGAALREGLGALRTAWGEPRTARRIVWPVTMVVGRV